MADLYPLTAPRVDAQGADLTQVSVQLALNTLTASIRLFLNQIAVAPPVGLASGDLSGTYPNPTVTAVHALSGTLDNVVVGGIVPVAGTFTTLNGVNATSVASLRADLVASTGAGLLGWIQSGVGAIFRFIRDKLRESVSVDDFGAVGDGIADDFAAIVAAQNSLTKGGTVNFTNGKRYKVGTAIPNLPGFTYKGTGRSGIDLTGTPGAQIVTSTSSIFTNAATTVTGVTFDGLWLESLAGGLHIFDWSAAGAIAKVEAKNCVLVQNNTGMNVVKGTAAGGVFSIWMHDFEYKYATGNTVPPMFFSSPTVNTIVIEKFWSTCATQATSGTHSIWIESTNVAAAGINNLVRQGVFELPGGGSVNMLSCINSGIEQCGVFDLTLPSNNPQFRIAKGAGAAASNCWVKGLRSTGGSTTQPDLQIDTSVSGQSNFIVDGCTLSWFDAVSTGNGPGILVKASSIANFKNFAGVVLGATATGDIEFKNTAGGTSRSYKLWNGYAGNGDGFFNIEQNGVYIGAYSGSGLFGWGGTRAAPATYMTQGGQLFTTAVILKRVAVVYSASMTIDNGTANEFDIVATNATAFTINTPLNLFDGHRITITIKNTSGGALGAVTFGGGYKLAAWTQPANGFSRSIDFKCDGTNWIEASRTPADVPN